MRRRSDLVDREILNPFFGYLLFCGIALLLSTPAALRVRNFEALSLLSGIPVFFYVHVLFSGILGLNLGAIGAARGETGRSGIARLVSRLLLGEALTLPYLVFEVALYPGRESVVVLSFAYAVLVGLLCALVASLLEVPDARGAHPFLLKYAAFAAYLTAPWAFQPVVSPLGMVDALFRGSSFGRLLLGFVAVIALLGIALGLACWREGRRHG